MNEQSGQNPNAGVRDSAVILIANLMGIILVVFLVMQGRSLSIRNEALNAQFSRVPVEVRKAVDNGSFTNLYMINTTTPADTDAEFLKTLNTSKSADTMESLIFLQARTMAMQRDMLRARMAQVLPVAQNAADFQNHVFATLTGLYAVAPTNAEAAAIVKKHGIQFNQADQRAPMAPVVAPTNAPRAAPAPAAMPR
jgi:hypothetical protein